MRNEMRAATVRMAADRAVPPAYLSGAEMLPGDGRLPCDDQIRDAIAEHTEIGADDRLSTKHVVPRGGESHLQVVNQSQAALTATISELIALQRQRTFCIVSQSRSDRSVESFIAKLIGMGPVTPEDATPAQKLTASKARKAVFAHALTVRKAVEKGGEVHDAHVNLKLSDLTPAYPLILLSAQAREGWDKHRAQVEKRMRKLAKTLPVWPVVEQIAGFGELGLAVLIAETGDLSNYATKERVWKRLGLAVIQGERQQRKSGAEAAAAHGYSPNRRAQIWSMVDPMFRHQWAGDKDEDGSNPTKSGKPVAVPAHAVGPYGAIYAARKAHTATREGWTPAHRENDARRVMTKALVEALWKAWRRGGDA